MPNGTETKPEPTKPVQEEKPTKPRTATKYAVAIWDENELAFKPILAGRDGATKRPLFKEYEGFKREDVLQDLIEAEVLATATDGGDKGKTDWVLITPISGARPVRGSVDPQPPKIGLE